MIFRNNTFKIIALFILLSSPFVSFGATEFDVNDFCAKLPAIEKKLDDRTTAITSIFDNTKSKFLDSIKNKWKARDEKRLQKQTDTETKLNIYITKITSKAKTEDQKQAVADYDTTIKNAINLRTSQTENALDVYRKGVEGIWTDIKNDESIQKYDESLNALTKEAKVACGKDNANDETIKKDFLDKLVDINKEFKDSFNPKEIIVTKLDALQDIKNKNLEDTESAFKKSIEDAKTTLFELF